MIYIREPPLNDTLKVHIFCEIFLRILPKSSYQTTTYLNKRRKGILLSCVSRNYINASVLASESANYYLPLKIMMNLC